MLYDEAVQGIFLLCKAQSFYFFAATPTALSTDVLREPKSEKKKKKNQQELQRTDIQSFLTEET